MTEVIELQRTLKAFRYFCNPNTEFYIMGVAKKSEAEKNTAILLVHCPDQHGILAAITEFINENNGNILYLDQHVDHQEGIFYTRIEWDLTDFLIPKEKIRDYFDTLFAVKYHMHWDIVFSSKKPRMAIMVSKMSHCLFDILARATSGEWEVEIPLIVSNHPDLEHIARRFDIPFYVFPVNKENKEEQEKNEINLLHEHNIDVIVLARYMQILSKEFISEFASKIINIHHSFLPAFIGAKPYHAAHERGVKIIGATSHYVTTDLDAGPIIEQDVTRITHKDTVQNLIHKGRDLEKIVLSRAVEKHLEQKILVYNNSTVVFKKIGKYFLAFLRSLLMVVIINAQNDDRGYIVHLGQYAPNFTAHFPNGDSIKLNELQGKVVMIQFTASWCGVCRKEMPFIERDIWQKYKVRKDFILLGIDLDEPAEKILEFRKSTGITYPLALDSAGKIFYSYAAQGAGVTRNVIIDKDGKIVFLTRLYNEDEFEKMKGKIFELLD